MEYGRQAAAGNLTELNRAKNDMAQMDTAPKGIAETVAGLLMKHHLTACCAESCTGGMIAAQLVGVPGVSAVFEAGFVTYSNRSKQRLLGVKKETLQQYGAVSSQVAAQMAEGAAKAAEADVAISVTGIAGPDGGTPEKPVGLVYIGCSVCGQVTVDRFHFSGDRQKVRTASAQAALSMAAECIRAYCEA